jgi:hypothetical protein
MARVWASLNIFDMKTTSIVASRSALNAHSFSIFYDSLFDNMKDLALFHIVSNES